MLFADFDSFKQHVPKYISSSYHSLNYFTSNCWLYWVENVEGWRYIELRVLQVCSLLWLSCSISLSYLFHMCCIVGLGSESEHDLVYDLFEKEDYNPLIRPVEDISEPINVSLGITLFQVITVVSPFLLLEQYRSSLGLASCIFPTFKL